MAQQPQQHTYLPRLDGKYDVIICQDTWYLCMCNNIIIQWLTCTHGHVIHTHATSITAHRDCSSRQSLSQHNDIGSNTLMVNSQPPTHTFEGSIKVTDIKREIWSKDTIVCDQLTFPFFRGQFVFHQQWKAPRITATLYLQWRVYVAEKGNPFLHCCLYISPWQPSDSPEMAVSHQPHPGSAPHGKQHSWDLTQLSAQHNQH